MGIDGKNLEETNVTGNDMSWHPDGTKLALQFVHGWPNWKNGFRIYDLQTKQLQIVGNQVGLLELDWSFDGKMLVCRQNYKIMVMNADGTNFRPFYAAPNPKECPYCHPCWHPLKLTVAWNSRQGLLVGDYNPSDGSATNVHSVVSFKDVGWEDPCPRWSPDGKYILWITQSKRLHVVRVSDQVFAELAIPREWRVEVWDYDWVAK
jgi:Tol biopolymer transport system component